MNYYQNVCRLCPRNCSSDRSSEKTGICNSKDKLQISKIMLHEWEEPCICQGSGAGTIFFSGCNLHCVYCQNRDISQGGGGRIFEIFELEDEIFSLIEKGASCIEFVTPTHYTHILSELLKKIKPALEKANIPVVWNSGGYEKAETLSMLQGLVDIYLPDFKYFSPTISQRYSKAPDYADVALSAVKEMLRQVGTPQFDENKRLLRGVMVRHLVLPSHREDSIKVLELLKDEIGAESILLSLMSQYTPKFYIDYENENGQNPDCQALRRKITSFEYNSVLNKALELGFDGYLQSKSSATEIYTPNFNA